MEYSTRIIVLGALTALSLTGCHLILPYHQKESSSIPDFSGTYRGPITPISPPDAQIWGKTLEVILSQKNPKDANQNTVMISGNGTSFDANGLILNEFSIVGGIPDTTKAEADLKLTLKHSSLSKEFLTQAVLDSTHTQLNLVVNSLANKKMAEATLTKQ